MNKGCGTEVPGPSTVFAIEEITNGLTPFLIRFTLGLALFGAQAALVRYF